MKQLEFRQSISVPTNNVRGVFEAGIVGVEDSYKIKLNTGGNINGFIPDNLMDETGNLLSLSIPSKSRWYLCLDGEVDNSGTIQSLNFSVKTTRPPAILVTPHIPPTSFSFIVYMGAGPKYVRTIGPSPTLKSILVYREYVIKSYNAASNFTNHYTWSFS